MSINERNEDEKLEHIPHFRNLDHLLASSQELVEAVEELKDEAIGTLSDVHRAQRRMRNVLIIATIAFIIDVILATGLIIGLHRQNENVKAINALTHAVDSKQTVLSQEAVCPFYQIFLETDTAQARAAAHDRVRFDQEYAAIKSSFHQLQCASYLDSLPSQG